MYPEISLADSAINMKKLFSIFGRVVSNIDLEKYALSSAYDGSLHGRL